MDFKREIPYNKGKTYNKTYNLSDIKKLFFFKYPELINKIKGVTFNNVIKTFNNELSKDLETGAIIALPFGQGAIFKNTVYLNKLQRVQMISELLEITKKGFEDDYIDPKVISLLEMERNYTYNEVLEGKTKAKKIRFLPGKGSPCLFKFKTKVLRNLTSIKKYEPIKNGKRKDNSIQDTE